MRDRGVEGKTGADTENATIAESREVSYVYRFRGKRTKGRERRGVDMRQNAVRQGLNGRCM